MRLNRFVVGTIGAVVLGGVTLTAQTVSTPGQASATVSVVGCIQHVRRTAMVGGAVPSGFVLMNASTTPFGGSLPSDPIATSGAADRPSPRAAGTSGSSEQANVARSGEPSAASIGGSEVSSGLTFLLDGADVAAHAGQRVEIRGTLEPMNLPLPLMRDSLRGGAPNDLPLRLRANRIVTLARNCSR
jgi:hypothetical protein